jgi:hypothetical protein
MDATAKRRPRNENEWSWVRLSMVGKHLDPKKITDALGIQPDISGKLGDPVAANSKKTCKQGYWKLECGRLNWRIERQMKGVLERITPVKDRLRRLIREDATIRQAYLTIAFELPQERLAIGYYFASELINEFTSLGVDINLSIWMPPEEDQGKARVS